ncbi:MAG: hypothetical protein II107_06930, partial [Prevotella sp.]|nr:hypothetical protein [Prevotella sp.]
MTKFIHQRFFKQFVQFTLTFVWVALFSSCIDNHYDIDKIDSTIGIGGDDFSLLGDNSTNEIPLEDIFDIENSRFVHVAEDGKYTLTGTNSAPFIMSTSIDPITISSSISREKEIVINLKDFSEKENNARPRKVRKEVTIERTIASLE